LLLANSNELPALPNQVKTPILNISSKNKHSQTRSYAGWRLGGLALHIIFNLK